MSTEEAKPPSEERPKRRSRRRRITYNVDLIINLLDDAGLVDREKRQELETQAPKQRAKVVAQRRRDIEGGRSGNQVSPTDVIASFGLEGQGGAKIDGDRIASLVADSAEVAYYKIDPLELDTQLITKTLSRPFALRHVALPIKRAGGKVVVAMENPFDLELLETLQRIAGSEIEPVVSSKEDIIKYIREVYGFRKSVESAAKQAHAPSHVSEFEHLVKLRSVGEIESNDQHVVNAVDFLLHYALDQRASDLHIEPRRDSSQVRLRIDGVLHNVYQVPRNVHPAVVSRIKTMARLDIAEKRRAQDGRIKMSFRGETVELRLSTMAVAFGEKVVIRMLDSSVMLQDLAELGFEGEDLTLFNRWIASPHGMLLVTGPTGSGKTTTLYSTLNYLANERINITTVEDPIEMVIESFNQVAVQPKIDINFASALRTILRQDPDVIMVGEIRDTPTVEMAVQAALTGHLMFSTLHTNDAFGAITRMLDLGVPAFLLGSTLIGSMAQRLVRKICSECREPAPLTTDEKLSLRIFGDDEDLYRDVCRGVGCIKCRGTGYYGRVGIFELLDFDDELAAMVASDTEEDLLRRTARTKCVRSLREAGLTRLQRGETTIEEVVRVTGACL